jgi:hypothetical protein
MHYSLFQLIFSSLRHVPTFTTSSSGSTKKFLCLLTGSSYYLRLLRCSFLMRIVPTNQMAKTLKLGTHLEKYCVHISAQTPTTLTKDSRDLLQFLQENYVVSQLKIYCLRLYVYSSLFKYHPVILSIKPHFN